MRILPLFDRTRQLRAAQLALTELSRLHPRHLRRSPSRHYERSRHLNSPTNSTPTMSTAELATSYAALILADDGVEITADKLNSLIQAAQVPDVEPIWSQLFAKALEGKDVKELLTNVGGGGAPAAVAAAPAAAAPAAGGDAAPAAEKKAEEKEESDEDMGFGLFD
ncbi:60S acidic ribosomal protein P1 [Salinomyces thailandicus]|uniref:Large ribosomal subunit protein P1 n=1 Tax=Salinomyces thailandicus TaxID=706561 RepID=A0A4U0TYN0_9PEZI|nr:60S acidic ribosomal protein P1 [Salinomyces thailandica]